jgi:hypothetical protein
MTDLEKLKEMVNRAAWGWTKPERSALLAGISAMESLEKEPSAYNKENVLELLKLAYKEGYMSGHVDGNEFRGWDPDGSVVKSLNDLLALLDSVNL